jgi:hypothetical protein
MGIGSMRYCSELQRFSIRIAELVSVTAQNRFHRYAFPPDPFMYLYYHQLIDYRDWRRCPWCGGKMFFKLESTKSSTNARLRKFNF